MKEAFEIARIIQKSLKGKLSESEEKLLSDWRKVSEENEHAFQRMISEDFYMVGMEKLETYDYRILKDVPNTVTDELMNCTVKGFFASFATSK